MGLFWPVSGHPQEASTVMEVVNTCSTHLLKIESYCDESCLDQALQRFWELDSLGIMKDESGVKERFTQRIAIRHGTYEVELPYTLVLKYLERTNQEAQPVSGPAAAVRR